MPGETQKPILPHPHSVKYMAAPQKQFLISFVVGVLLLIARCNAYAQDATLTISSITGGGSNVLITFEAVQGATYRLQRKFRLEDSAWQSIPGVNDLTAVTNGPAQISDPGAFGLGTAFYRLRLMCLTTWSVDAVIGSDSNLGTCEAPFKTITKALSVATSGATIQIKPGTYNSANGELFPLTVPAGVHVFGNAASRGARPVTKVVGNIGFGGSGASLSGIWVVGKVTINTNNIAIANCSVDNTGAYGIYISAGTGVTVNSNTVTQCLGGVVLVGSSSASLSGNTISGNIYNVEIVSPATADLGGGPLNSSGGNSLSCATNADLWTNGALPISAKNNHWDHAPPTVSTASGTGGVDIYESSMAVVTHTPYAAIVPSPCQ